MKTTFVVLACAVAAISLTGCKEKVTANASCGEVELFESNLGLVNVPHFILGNYFWVDPKNKTAGGLGVVSFNSDKKWESPVTTEIKVDYDSSMSIGFDAELPEAVQAALKTAITKSTQLIAHNVKRTSLGDAAGVLNSDPAAKKVIADHLKHAPGNIIYIVHSVLNANSLSINLANASDTSANANVVNYGKYELSVKYQCDNALSMTGNQSSAFFKATAIGYDATSDSLYVDTTEKLSLSQVSLSQAK
jgi:hypothetical protein